jgi:hypothetical protein
MHSHLYYFEDLLIHLYKFLKSFDTQCHIIYDIYHIFTSLNNIGINVILEWIPSHVGILGNELADQEAKHSLSFKNIYVLILFCLSSY